MAMRLLSVSYYYYFSLRKRKDTAAESEWTCLPDLVSLSIIEKLLESNKESNRYVIHFGAVCKQWYAQSKDYFDMKRNYHGHQAHPMLLFENGKLFCVKQHKFIHDTVHVPLEHGNCCGSCCGGWLALYKDENKVITLVNPFKRGRSIIHLPPLDAQVKGPIGNFKLVLSADPHECPENYIVVVNPGVRETLRYVRPGKEAARWALIDDEYVEKGLKAFNDLIFYKGLLYAVTFHGKLVCVDFQSSPTLKVLAEDLPKMMRLHLVESSRGDLLLIQSYFKQHITRAFKVYKLLIDDQQCTNVIEMNGLEGDTLFVGPHHSISAQHTAFPSFSYPATDHNLTNGSFCAYNMKDWTISRSYPNASWIDAGFAIGWVVPPFEFHNHKLA